MSATFQKMAEQLEVVGKIMMRRLGNAVRAVRRHAVELEVAGATHVVTADAEAGLALGASVARELGAAQEELDPLMRVIQNEMSKR